MKNLRQLLFFYLITLTGLLWAAFLLMFNSDWFFEGLSLVGLILATNVVVLIIWLRS